MKLIIGGAYQGKKAFACSNFQIEEKDFVDGRSCDKDSLVNAKGIHHLQDYIRRMLEEEIDPMETILHAVKENPKLVILCNEMGCGLVPVDAFDRKYRETVGRITCKLAEKADAVYRIYCGIGVKMK